MALPVARGCSASLGTFPGWRDGAVVPVVVAHVSTLPLLMLENEVVLLSLCHVDVTWLACCERPHEKGVFINCALEACRELSSWPVCLRVELSFVCFVVLSPFCGGFC